MTQSSSQVRFAHLRAIESTTVQHGHRRLAGWSGWAGVAWVGCSQMQYMLFNYIYIYIYIFNSYRKAHCVSGAHRKASKRQSQVQPTIRYSKKNNSSDRQHMDTYGPTSQSPCRNGQVRLWEGQILATELSKRNHLSRNNLEQKSLSVVCGTNYAHP